MSSILGLITSDEFSSHWSNSSRRRVFHHYPNGKAPLMGLLSLMETEEIDKPQFGWYEQPMDLLATVTAQANSAGPFTNTSGTDLTSGGWTQAANTSIRVYIGDDSEFVVNQQIQVSKVPLAAGGTVDFQAVITAIDRDNDYLTVQLLETVTGALNTTAANGLVVTAIGSAYGEGYMPGSGRWKAPINPINYTQIFRRAFSFSRTATKAGVNFDKTGLYKEKAKQNSLDICIEMERAFIFGTRTSVSVTDPEDSEPSVRRTTGGVLWFLQQYELSGGGTFGYRPGGSALTANTDEDKRILSFSSGSISRADWDGYVERMFRETNSRVFEKLVLCGSGVLTALNQYIGERSLATRPLVAEKAYGMNFYRWESPHGTLLFKTHPLFTAQPLRRYDAMVLDVQNLAYRPLVDSDLQLYRNRAKRGQDRRKDEWLAEAGLELINPASHMYISNLRSIV